MQWRKKQQRAYDPEKGLYKQADLDKQFETYVKDIETYLSPILWFEKLI